MSDELVPFVPHGQTEQVFGEPIPMVPFGQVIFCHICPHTKINLRRPIVLCTTFSGEGRCEEHRDIPDTELPVPPTAA